MFVPYINRRRSIQCPITGKKFWHNGSPKRKVLALREQQEFTSNLIIELDGECAGGIRRHILWYHNEYNRRYGPRTATADAQVIGSTAVSAA